jgi:hypothetical protein
MRIPLIGSIVLALFIAETALAQKYPIRLSSPDDVGRKHWISLTGRRHQQLSATQNGRVLKPQSSDLFVIFEGREEILAVDSKGIAVRESFTVEKFTKTEDGVTSVLLKPGSVIITDGSQPDSSQVMLQGGEMDEASRAAFSMLMPPHIPNSLTDDEVFGTTEPRGIGDSWTINTAAAVEDLKESLVIPIERISGLSTISSKDIFGGDECLNMVSEVRADSVALKLVPSGFVPDLGTLQMTVRACVPIQSSAASRKETGELLTVFRVKGIPGSPSAGITMEILLNQKVDLISLPVRP